MASKVDSRIETLEGRLNALKAQRNKKKARERTIQNRRNRQEETRRKILVGAIVLAKVDQGVMDRDTLLGWLDAALERADDRALFEELGQLPTAGTPGE